MCSSWGRVGVCEGFQPNLPRQKLIINPNICEPASAASVAGLIKNKNRIQKGSKIVCVLTGNGLKDPDCAIKNNDAIFRKNIEASLKNITKILGY